MTKIKEIPIICHFCQEVGSDKWYLITDGKGKVALACQRCAGLMFAMETWLSQEEEPPKP